ncbi:hypothetical protein [Absidia glauca]|uniref:NADH:flavin oxidoreductase/NADH oxidase N-terminal domain-containing protein n=1 Tax=Absidia glauca TaxID=4829 RepID=A0A163TI19_ABSGL|nr:hypothetical protein [Absidia glauca]
MSTPTLLTPIKIGEHTLEHRVVLAPLTRLRNTEEGVIQGHVVEYYTQRATKGGFLLTEATLISPSAGGYKYAPGIYTDEQIEGWRKVTNAVHAKGAIIYNQLWHIGRATHSSCLPNNELPVAASAIAIKGKNLFGDDFEVPHALTVDEIKALVQDFVAAAKNALKAGFDGIEVHCGNGYLVDTFINTSSNTRTDKYGGSIENRARFPLELLDALVEAIGANKVALRFSPWSGFQDMEDDTPVETWSYLTQQIQTNHSDLAYLHFVESREGGHSDEELLEHESLDPFRNIWQGPFITSGGFTDPKKAIERCEISPNNLISFGRLFIANPDLVDRIRNDWPLNKYHRPTFYTQGLDGYIDYPFYTPTTSTDGDNDDDIVPVAKVTDGLAVAESAATDDATADAAVTESNSETVQQPDTKADKRKSKKSSTAKCIIQ